MSCTIIGMTCSVGRATQKYKGSSAASTLQDVTENGNTTTLSIVTDSYFIGDGSQLTNLPGFGGYGTFQQVSDNGNTTSNTIQFTNTANSIVASGNVIATNFYGNGTTLTGVALASDLVSNATRITHIESNLASNSTRISNLEASNGYIWSNLASNSTRISNLEASNGYIWPNLASNSTRISNLEASNGYIWSNLASNAGRISDLETSNGYIWSNLASNSTRISNLEASNGYIWSNLTSNSTRISNLEASNGYIWSNLASNAGRISDLETSNGTVWSNLFDGVNPRITALEGETQPVNRGGTGLTSYTIGDLLYASSSTALSKITIGSTNQVLTVSGGIPSWQNATGGGTSLNNITEIGSNTGISNTTPQYTLHVGSNVIIDDEGTEVLYVVGNVYSTNELIGIRGVRTNALHTGSLFIKNSTVIAERPTRKITLT